MDLILLPIRGNNGIWTIATKDNFPLAKDNNSKFSVGECPTGICHGKFIQVGNWVGIFLGEIFGFHYLHTTGHLRYASSVLSNSMACSILGLDRGLWTLQPTGSTCES